MPTPQTLTRALPLIAATAAVALISTGCGATNADPSRGRALFIQTCGSCHTLAQAATTGTQGPNLDDAFAAARAAGGFNADTIAGLVKAQVEFPRPITSNPAISMPPKLLGGQELEDVAAYVGSVAGVPRLLCGATAELLLTELRPPELHGFVCVARGAQQLPRSPNRSSIRTRRSRPATRRM